MPPPTGSPVVVLIVAAGAEWESPALGLLGAHPGIVVLKRCVDLDDLLATAAAGQADVAVLGLDSHGLDVTAVDHLRGHGVRPVAVAPAGVAPDVARLRATRVAIHAVVPEAAIGVLVDEVLREDPAPGAATSRPSLVDALAGVSAQVEAPGRAVAVWGPAGAPGRTTVATGLAAAIARRGLRTVLVDADPHGGTVAQGLGILDEVSGILSAARLAAAGDLAAQFASVQRGLDERLTVVTGLPRADRWSEVRAGTVEAVVQEGRRAGHVVVDTGSSIEGDPAADFGSRPGRNQMTVAALEVADEVLVVGTPDPVGLTRLARALAELEELGSPAPVRVVLNRVRPSLGWSQREVAAVVARFAGDAPLHLLPDDRAGADRALVSGRSVLEAAPDSPLTKALVALADVVLAGRPAR